MANGSGRRTARIVGRKHSLQLTWPVTLLPGVRRPSEAGRAAAQLASLLCHGRWRTAELRGIAPGGTSPAAQFIFVGGDGNNRIDVDSASPAEVVVAGEGNNHIRAAGAGDFVEVLGNGNNHVTDTGTSDLIWLGGDGNNEIDNQGDGSFTEVLAGAGHNRIRGRWGIAP